MLIELQRSFWHVNRFEVGVVLSSLVLVGLLEGGGGWVYPSFGLHVLSCERLVITHSCLTSQYKLVMRFPRSLEFNVFT